MLKKIESDTQNENIFWRKIKYVNKNSLSLGNKLIKKAIKPAYYNKRTTGNFLINNKPRTSMEEKSGVYQIKCSDCDSIYIGLTSRSLHKRFSEHVVRPESNVAQHMAETGHSFDISNATILHSESKMKKLSCLEMMYIKEAVSKKEYDILNSQTTFHSRSPLLNVGTWFHNT